MRISSHFSAVNDKQAKIMVDFTTYSFDYDYDILFDSDDPDFAETRQLKRKLFSQKTARVLDFEENLGGDKSVEKITDQDIEFFFETPFSLKSRMRQVEMNHSSSPFSMDSELSILDDLRSLHTTSDNVNIEDLKNLHSSCSTCGVSWNEDHVSLDCFECGGYSMERPCPICDGQCKQIWQRDITMSHSMRKAHWEGECGLPANEQQTFILKNLIDISEDSLSEALEELNTSS